MNWGRGGLRLGGGENYFEGETTRKRGDRLYFNPTPDPCLNDEKG